MLNRLKSTLHQISEWLFQEHKTGSTVAEPSHNKVLNVHLGLLFLAFLAVFVTNFPFSSFFTGWDNLHPEFNLLLNLKRGFAYAFQSNQGLGTFGGHGYSANLPHTLVIWILSLVTPIMYVRSVFTFLMLMVGSLGIFYLTYKILNNTRKITYTASLFAGLYYMLNFATVQNFYAQLESFIIHFAALPWLILAVINYLQQPTRKNLALYALLIFFGGSMGFIPPLFIVYLLMMGVYCGCYYFNQPSWSRLKRCLILGVVTLGVNLYWILPLFYYTVSGSDNYINAYNNLASTNDFILKNKKFGSLGHLAILRGFLVEQFDTFGDKLILIAWNWKVHLAQRNVEIAGYVLFILSIIGTIKLFVKTKWYQVATAVGFLMTFAFLATDVPILKHVTSLLQNISVYRQAFRIAFTKFSISVSFFYSIGIGAGVLFLLTQVQSMIPSRMKRRSIFYTSILIATCLIYFIYPIFQGNFIYPRAKTTIPQQYFALSDYLKTQPKDGRILHAPVGWNWGWTIYKWGYTGSGLLWYGIEQPIIDRSFDVWESTNENLYWELSKTLFSEQFEKANNVLYKHQINWVLFDENIVPYPNVKSYKYSSKFKDHLSGSAQFQLEKIFEDPTQSSAPLYLYKVIYPLNIPSEKMALLTSSTLNIGPYVKWNDQDTAFAKQQTYITNARKPYDMYVPFRSLFTGRKTIERYFGVDQNSDGTISFLAKLNTDIRGFDTIADGSLLSEPAIINASVENDKTAMLRVQLSQTDTPAVYNSYFDPNFLDHSATDCGSSSSGLFEQTTTNDNTLKFTSQNSDNCYDIVLPELSHKKSYLLAIAHKHHQGKPMQFALINHDSNRADIDTSLSTNSNFKTDYFIISPSKEDSIGYSLHFNNNSIGEYITENEIGDIQLYEIPFNYLSSMSFVNKSKYASNETLAYYYSHHKEFKAYALTSNSYLEKMFPFITGKELKNHYRVNSWANGWEVDCKIIECDTSKFVVIFWPQYLQFAGLTIVIILLTLVFVRAIAQKKLNHTPLVIE